MSSIEQFLQWYSLLPDGEKGLLRDYLRGWLDQGPNPSQRIRSQQPQFGGRKTGRSASMPATSKADTCPTCGRKI